jgi:nucleotide-binding universal stress UspA family protein
MGLSCMPSLRSLMLGSVSQKCAAHAPCTVLVARDPTPAP